MWEQSNAVEGSVSFILVLSTVSRLGFLFYWAYENFGMLTKTTFFKGDAPRIFRKAAQFWLIGLISGLLVELHKLRQSLKNTRKNSSISERALYMKKHQTILLNIFKIFGDMIPAAHVSNFAHAVKGTGFSESSIAMGGLLSALISCFQQYQTLNYHK
eukprot:GHVL01033039.1.p1 GENE.GHVL01033039.1~~GHVL01033039.1.p1  ORF type:complete len:158 (+),score=15.70 GHVL01033039.1:491-964(+)